MKPFISCAPPYVIRNDIFLNMG